MDPASAFDWSLTAARALVYLALLPTAGLPLYLLSTGRGAVLSGRLRAVLVVLAVTGAAASAWWTLASVAAMAAQPITALDAATVSAVLDATPLGLVMKVRLAALIALAAFALLPLARWRLPLLALAGATALFTCAYTGHAGASEGAMGHLHRLADEIHLLAAGTWLAALGVFLASAFGTSQDQPFEVRLAAFARTGTVIVAALMLTGVVNALAILGWPLPPTFPSGLWAGVLAAKLALFGAMLGLAALNRWRLTPALASGDPGARTRLRRSLMLETALALGVVALVALLGLLDPQPALT
ncbi:MAG: copper homeostasis membrane protein CopD [Novosphingobium sp.]